jgi:S-disulfanyl-L-cysteine oxidoreductase SoxD
MRGRRFGGAAAVMLTSLLTMIGPGVCFAGAQDAHFANGADLALVTRGKQVYRGLCASCHGKNLQGQPLWQLEDQFAGRRAPAHDESGHTWQHGDEELFRKTKYGRFPSEPNDATSAMPAFAGALDDQQIVAVLAFIKSRWPLGLRVAQAMLNPGFAGLPADADTVEWRLPPNCNALLRRQGATSIIKPD